MQMQVQSYLFFNGCCEEAIEFYKKAVGAKVEMLMRFKEAPGDHKCMPGTEEKIMHSSIRVGDTLVNASDGMAQGQPDFKGFSLVLNPQDKAEVERLFGALSAVRYTSRWSRRSSRRASACALTSSASAG